VFTFSKSACMQGMRSMGEFNTKQFHINPMRIRQCNNVYYHLPRWHSYCSKHIRDLGDVIDNGSAKETAKKCLR
jgi:hypothetical protein